MKNVMKVTCGDLARLIADAYENDFNRTPAWTLLDLFAKPCADIRVAPVMIHAHRHGEPAELHVRSEIRVDGKLAAAMDNSFDTLSQIFGLEVVESIRGSLNHNEFSRLKAIDDVKRCSRSAKAMSRYLVLQQGGASAEWYSEFHETRDAAEARILEIEDDSYHAIGPFRIPLSMGSAGVDTELLIDSICSAVARLFIDEHAASVSRLLRLGNISHETFAFGKAPNGDAWVSERRIRLALAPREFFLVLGDIALADCESKSGIASVNAYATVSEVLDNLREWVVDAAEDVNAADQVVIGDLLESGKVAGAVDLFCRSTGRWWLCYHPDHEEDLKALIAKDRTPAS